MLEATDENDFAVAIVVLRRGTNIDKDEQERSARIGRLQSWLEDGC